MNQKTKQQLVEINRRFYQETAKDFSDTRQHSWEGWKILEDKYLSTSKNLKVLDIGCGNGRFGTFLFENHENITYTGVDFSAKLLEVAEKSLSGFEIVTLQQLDIDSIDTYKKDGYDLVVMFGVMHHVPGFESRVKLLQDVTRFIDSNVISSEVERSLKKNVGDRDFSASGRNLISRNDNKNILIVSFWQFGNFERFKKKIVSWDVLPEIDQDDLEEGDFLLDFNGSPPYRYCHSFSDEEIDTYKNILKDRSTEEFQADGREKYNYYLVFYPKKDS